MKKYLFILLIFIGVFIMLKPVNAIIKDSIGNIIYRGNVVTGIVAVDNGDKSYDVFISESDRAYPKIFTLSANPDLEVGDKVRILYKNGCKELPIILPPVTAMGISKLIFASYYDGSSHYYIAVFNLSGVLQRTIDVGTDELKGQNALCVDTNNNCYYVNDNKEIVKINSSGTELLRVACFYDGGSKSVAIGADGYIYELGMDTDYDRAINKLDPDTLAILGTFKVNNLWNTYYGITVDPNNVIYIVNDSANTIEKYAFDGGYITNKSFADSHCASLPCLGILNNYIYGNYFLHNAWKIKSDFSEDETKVDMVTMINPYGAGGGDGTYIYYLGENAGGNVCVGQCNADLTENWVTEIGNYTAQGGIAAYPF